MVQVLTSLTGLTHLALRGKKITATVINEQPTCRFAPHQIVYLMLFEGNRREILTYPAEEKWH